MADTIVPQKRCTKCKQEYPATPEYFNVRRVSKDGLNSCCKHCTREADAKYRRAKGQKPRSKFSPHSDIPGYKRCTKCGVEKPATSKFFRLHSLRNVLQSGCRECENEQSRTQRAKDPDRFKAYSARSRLKHQDRIKEGARQRYRNNPQRYKENQRRYRQRHPERVRLLDKERHDRYRRNNPAVFRAKNARREAREHNLPCSFTRQDWQRALEYFNDRCAVCGRPTGLWHTLAQDHWIPLSDPRPDNPGTVATNIVPLCHGQSGCNDSKRNKDPLQWLTQKYGKRKASRILRRIEEYFLWVENQP
jgi:hypothetical protein